MDSNEDEDNTGTYFDDDVMEDIVEGEEDMDQRKRNSLQKKGKRKAVRKKQEDSPKDNRYYEYELVGVLVHSGTADGGHYYSYIKERGSNKWFEFNDKTVREFDAKDLPKECFGGENRGRSGGLLDEFDTRFFETHRNAYLLFYDRV